MSAMARDGQELPDLRSLVQRLNRLTGLKLATIQRLIDEQPNPPGQPLQSPLHDKTRRFRPELLIALDTVYEAHVPEYPTGGLARANRTGDLGELRRFLKPPRPALEVGSSPEDGTSAPEPEVAALGRVVATPGAGLAPSARRIAVVVAVACLLAASGWAWSTVRPNQIHGVVSCVSGADVAGVWVSWADALGWGSFAELSNGSEPGEWEFTARTPLFTPVSVRVGCGGTPQRWGVVTVSQPLGSSTANLVCDDLHRPPVVPGVCVVVA